MDAEPDRVRGSAGGPYQPRERSPRAGVQGPSGPRGRAGARARARRRAGLEPRRHLGRLLRRRPLPDRAPLAVPTQPGHDRVVRPLLQRGDPAGGRRAGARARPTRPRSGCAARRRHPLRDPGAADRGGGPTRARGRRRRHRTGRPRHLPALAPARDGGRARPPARARRRGRDPRAPAAGQERARDPARAAGQRRRQRLDARDDGGDRARAHRGRGRGGGTARPGGRRRLPVRRGDRERRPLA